MVKTDIMNFRSGILIIVMILLSAHVRGQEPLIKGDSLLIVEAGLKKLNKNINFTIIPGPVVGATQKVGFVVLPMLVYDLDKKDDLSPPSSSAVMFYFDFYGSWQVAVKQSFYWNQNKWRAFITGGVGNLHQKFFGIGRDTVIINNDESNYDWTRLRNSFISVSCYRKIFSGFYGGLEYSYINSVIAADDSTGQKRLSESGMTDGEQIEESILIPTFVWDNRDNIFWTTKGYYANLTFQFSNRILLSSNDYGVFTGWVNGYHKLLRNSRRLTLAWHFYIQSGWGDLPYSRYSIFTQGDDATGYTQGKYVDKSEFNAQTELRYDLWKFISLGGYMGTGKVFPSIDLLWKSVWLHYGGIRLYMNVIPSRNIRIRLDFALAREDIGFYVGVGQGF